MDERAVERAVEIAMEVERAYEDGTYLQWVSEDADREAARLGALLAGVLELTDEDVDAVLASIPDADAVDAETLASEVRRAIRAGTERGPEPSTD
jgi:hypothetical protein